MVSEAGVPTTAGNAAPSCRTPEQMEKTILYGYHVEAVEDEGERCCYRYYYPCE
jgi:hypothetical protein